MAIRPNIATIEGMAPAAISRDTMIETSSENPPVVPQTKPNLQMQELNKRLKEYFANKPRSTIAADLVKKVEDYHQFLEESGRLYLMGRSYRYYYRGADKKGQISRGGDQDEFFIGHFNQYRNILQHLINMTTSQRPSLEPRAANTDSKSQGQTIIARGALDYYQREIHLDRIFKKATEHSVYLSQGFVVLEWDENAGEDYVADPELVSTKKQGDAKITNHMPFDVAYDYTRTSTSGHDWYIVRFWENRYDMAAKYPELADKILLLAKDENRSRLKMPWYTNLKDSDLIAVYRFYHKKTPSVPEGRFVEFLSSEVVTRDGAFPYRRMNVYQMSADDQDGTSLAYTIAFDLLPIQEAIDGLVNTILTNAATHGIPNVAVPDTANIDVNTISGVMNVIKYDSKAGKPEALDLMSIPPELFNFVNMLIQMMETLSGLNSVVRGNPEASLKSGAALALVASQAIQFNSGLQQSYAQLLEDVGTGIVDILKQYANTPRIASIAGKSNRSFMREFTGKDLSDINRVTVEMGNPLSRTTAGKMQIADTLLERQLIKTPEEYIQLVTTGRLEPLIQGQQMQLTLIQAENERLAEEEAADEQFIDPITGTQGTRTVSSVRAVLTDDHVLHIKEHQAVLSSPESRENPEIVKNALAHLKEHMDILMGGDPILALLGQPSLAPPMPLPGQGGEGGSPADVADATNPVTKEAEAVNLPQQPINPQTGERYVPGGSQ